MKSAGLLKTEMPGEHLLMPCSPAGVKSPGGLDDDDSTDEVPLTLKKVVLDVLRPTELKPTKGQSPTKEKLVTKSIV